MAYIAPIHQPSSVRHALRMNLLSADEENLVLGRANRLELWTVKDGLLTRIHSASVNGTISMIEKLRPKDSTTDLLFVGTDRFRYFTAQWNPHTGRLDVVQELDDVGEKHMRDSQSQDRCLVDPTGKFMAMHLWEGVLNVMRLYTRGSRRLELDRMDQVRLSELFIKASTFLYTETGHPKIAFLYQSRADARDTKLVIYQLTGDDRNTTSSRFDRFRDREFTLDVADDGCVLMIPVRKVEEERKRHNVRNPDGTRVLLGGLLLVTETKLLYIDEMTKATLESPLAESSIFVAWAEIDPRHYFLADDYGHLHVLTISTPEGVVVTQMEMVKFGKTSRASCLQYLGNSLLFVGSHHGDSQLFRFDLSRKRGNYLELVQTEPNIGPVLDFSIMDMGNRESDSNLGNEYSSGQARIVVSEDHSMYGRRSITLGTRQARFHLVPKSEGIFSIFATTELPSLIYGAEGRIVYSAVTADEVEFVCPLNCNAFPDSVVVATGAEVKISQIDSERRTHVRPLPMGKMVRRVAYSPKEKVFALGCIQRDLVQGEEMVQSSVELVDEVIFDRVGKPFLLETVEYLELVEAVVRAELTDAYGNPAERFI
ncbi:hypothetical protein P8C59_005040 [Phyllachora maydis]|uniref:RSE1/DDB1/CPSF1 first beta-propeller domain-containing protein n=1 Tax=Phyllachora maydis TaxID=1825666 RepID=A0AAD9I4Q6_9PEZI|nr:hypothetical protein P8C59_005040 [Phyllachora maydis]